MGRGLIKTILVHGFNSLALLSRPPAVLFSFGLVAPTCFIFFGLAAPTCFIFIWPTVCFIFTWPRGPYLFYFFLAPTDLDSWGSLPAVPAVLFSGCFTSRLVVDLLSICFESGYFGDHDLTSFWFRLARAAKIAKVARLMRMFSSEKTRI